MYGNAQAMVKQDRAYIGEGPMETPVSMPEIAREHAALRESVEFLGHVVSTLHERLQPVVMQRPQAVGAGSTQKELGCASPLGQSISAATGGIRAHAERLQDLLQSLAV